MTILHYQVSRLDRSWVISCEDVPIDLFDARKDAVGAAMKLVRAARTRGDQAILHIHSRYEYAGTFLNEGDK